MCNDHPFRYTYACMPVALPRYLSIRGARLYAEPVRDLTLCDEDDAALVRRIAAAAPGRDTAAESEVCRRFAPRIRLFGLRHLRGEAAAADLMQEALLIALQRLRVASLREPGRLASYVLGIARQCMLDWRRNTARRERILESFPLDLPPLSEEPAEPIDDGRLRHCLGGLSERERAVLLLTFYDNCSADAVAVELGLSGANVRVIRHRGLQRLRDCMNLRGALP